MVTKWGVAFYTNQEAADLDYRWQDIKITDCNYGVHGSIRISKSYQHLDLEMKTWNATLWKAPPPMSGWAVWVILMTEER